MTPPAPEKQHTWLKQLLGEWTTESEAFMGPDEPMHKGTGKESVRALGDLWTICEGVGNAPDGTPAYYNIFTFGYDPAKSKFVGTFIGSMMPSLWIYEGTLDPAERILTLDCQGPSFTDPSKLTDYKDSIEIVDADHRILRSAFKGDDGTWTSFMTARYTRVK